MATSPAVARSPLAPTSASSTARASRVASAVPPPSALPATRDKRAAASPRGTSASSRINAAVARRAFRARAGSWSAPLPAARRWAPPAPAPPSAVPEPAVARRRPGARSARSLPRATMPERRMHQHGRLLHWKRLSHPPWRSDRHVPEHHLQRKRAGVHLRQPMLPRPLLSRPDQRLLQRNRRLCLPGAAELSAAHDRRAVERPPSISRAAVRTAAGSRSRMQR